MAIEGSLITFHDHAEIPTELYNGTSESYSLAKHMNLNGKLTFFGKHLISLGAGEGYHP